MFLSPAGKLKFPATRIVSLVPSQTELLHNLGLTTEVIGITKFCIHPADWYRNKLRVGGTKDVDIDRVIEIKPDLIIANKEENVKEEIDMLANRIPVWLTEVDTYKEALVMIEDVGKLVNRNREGLDMVQQIKTSFDGLNSNAVSAIPACYLIWKDPFMTVGHDTFISDMMTYAGFSNVFATDTRYPTVTIPDIVASGCEVVLLSSEPYPFKAKHQAELASLLPGITILLVDGEMFSWYGSRLLLAPAYFRELQQQLRSEAR